MKVKHLKFVNPPESTERVPTNCLPPKASRTLKERFKATHKAIIQELDYISKPRTHYDHLARVLEAKRMLGLINYQTNKNELTRKIRLHKSEIRNIHLHKRI